jgi:hypothetical protein
MCQWDTSVDFQRHIGTLYESENRPAPMERSHQAGL